MSDITLITPPDKLRSRELSFLLVYPGSIVKDQFQTLISNFNIPIHLYLYDNDNNVEWLLDVFERVDFVVLDIDNCPSKVRGLVSYFITKDKTFWLTNGNEHYYNVLSNNRIFALDFLNDIVGGKIEQARQE